MFSIVVNVILLVLSLVTGLIMMFFSKMDIWNFLLTNITLLISTISIVINFWLARLRERKILSICKMYKISDLVERATDDYVRVSMGRQRAGREPMPDFSIWIKDILKKHKKVISEHISLFRLKGGYSTFCDYFTAHPQEFKKELLACKQKMKLSETEELVYKAEINIK